MELSFVVPSLDAIESSTLKARSNPTSPPSIWYQTTSANFAKEYSGEFLTHVYTVQLVSLRIGEFKKRGAGSFLPMYRTVN